MWVEQRELRVVWVDGSGGVDPSGIGSWCAIGERFVGADEGLGRMWEE